MDQHLVYNNSPLRSIDLTSRGETPAALIDLPLRSHSRIEHSPERIDRSENHPAHGYCEANTPAETIAGPNREHASVHAHAANMGILPNHDGGERRREKVKKFAAEKGPRIAGAAAAIGMFISNVVTSCS